MRIAVSSFLLLMLCQSNGFAQTNQTMGLTKDTIIGSWSGKAGLRETDMDMWIEGTKRFSANGQVNDRLTSTFVFKQQTQVPVIIAMNLDAKWSLSGTYLCEEVTRFDVSIVSRPNDALVPAMLVAQLLERLQGSLEARVKSKKPMCNDIVFFKPNEFRLRDGSSTMVTRFERRK